MPVPYAAYVAETISDLVNPQSSGHTEVTVLGRTVKGDGLGGTFYWATGSYITDNGTIFPRAAVGSNPAGAWLRVIEGDYNFKWFAPHADGVTDDSALLASVISAAAAANKKLFVPAGNYLLNSTVYLVDNAIITGLPFKTVFISTTLTGNMFESIGHSRIKFENISFTNTHTAYLNSFIQFKSDPNPCTDNTVVNCKFTDSWVGAAIFMGGAAPGDSTHWNDNVVIDRCLFQNLYKNGYLHITDTTADYFSERFCCGINLNQTTLRCVVKQCIFDTTSGDALFGYGAGSNYVLNPLYMNWEVYSCYFNKNNMCIEFNGDHGGSGVNIHDNSFNNPWLICVSVSCENERICNNRFSTAERIFIETESTNSVISGNIGLVTTWTNSSQGYPSPTQVVGSSRIHFVEAYGYNLLIEGNNFVADRSNPNSTTPLEFNGIALNGKSNDMRAGTQRSSYLGITDYTTYSDVKNNTLVGCTNRLLDVTLEKVRNVVFQDNTAILPTIAEVPINIYGYGWSIKNNVFDLSGATQNAGQYVIKVRTDQQADHSNSVVTGNLIINDTWKIGTLDKLIAFRNEFRMVPTVGNTPTMPASGFIGSVYSLYPAPPVTQTQRTALTGAEGMHVYQTDGTIGTYIYTSGAWKRVDLV